MTIKHYPTKLCHCNNPTSTPFEKMGRYELKDNKHTSFMVTICQTCNKPIFFPHDNFILAIDEGTEETLEKIAQIIIKWIKNPQ